MAGRKAQIPKYKFHVRMGKGGPKIDMDEMTPEQKRWICQALSNQMAEACGYEWNVTPEQRKAFYDAKPDYSNLIEKALEEERLEKERKEQEKLQKLQA